MDSRRKLMLLGFGAAFAGDWFLAIRGGARGSSDFLAGVAAFAAAQILWMLAHRREAHVAWRTLLAVSVPLGCFFGVRLFPVLRGPSAWMVGGYTLLSAFALSWAVSTRRLWYAAGIALLLVSDLMIGNSWLLVPFAAEAVGPLYIAAELSLLTSFFLKSERRLDFSRGNPFSIGIWTVFLSLIVFFIGMATYPGGDYNPCLRMLSALGRTEVRLVEYPLCHFLFVLGMVIAALGIARLVAVLGGSVPSWFVTGAALNVAGLLTIAAVPENVNVTVHNAGCWLAAIGGGVMLFTWLKNGGQAPWNRLVWGVLLLLPCCLLGIGLQLHELKVVPFAPWVPTAQKALILCFMAWFLQVSWSYASKAAKRLSVWLLVALVGVGWCVLGRSNECPPLPSVTETERPLLRSAEPLSEDEQAALRWLAFVTGKLSDADEKKWWAHGERQFGVFSLRYNIAFAGYAAAAIGWRMRGDDSAAVEVRARVGRILGHCIERYLQPEVWGYSQSRRYWGRKPWAPDPCFRENVMYTGHLLQLLAFYEAFTGDRKYWTKGFDFVWKGKRVHYDVKKLIEVTVRQMRKGPNGGITCEPGLMFFPCNNHPHLALRVFSRLGHGDWTKEARRWERWALGHYRRPLFGGGALNLVYHVKSGLLYPRGSSGLDGWSLLWYEPWAADRAAVLSLWREAVAAFDWPELLAAGDAKGGRDCCDPEPVPGAVAAAFLAAAARACDDPETAGRLEAAVDAQHLAKADGFYYLDLDRRWRIGATAHRIVALAESRGFRFREALDYAIMSENGKGQ